MRSSLAQVLALVTVPGLALAGLAVPCPASAQTSLVGGLGGAAGYGTSCLGPNDDGSSRMIDLTPIFPSGVQFFDRTHSVLFVNTNGNVTFGEGVAAYTPSSFPIADQPMIAPFWADVDVRPSARVMGVECGGLPDGSGRPEYTYAGDCASPAEDGVWWHLDVPSQRVVVTWDRVGYYRCHTDRRMSFQLILTAVSGTSCGGGGDFDVEFRFGRCEWNTGDASGGAMGLPRDPVSCVNVPGSGWVCPLGTGLRCTGGGTRTCSPVPAQSGFDAGNLTDFVEIMGSRTATIHTTLCTGSNVGEPGVWRFQIRQGVVECPGAGDACSTGMAGVCATGRTQCVGGGIECRPEVAASPERCDGLDNDCSGAVDDGTLCAEGEICDRGVCLGRCFEGGCVDGEVCTDEGRCVAAGCESITCPEGERCLAGACVGACDGITCPAGQACRAGRCVDLCAGAVCDDCTVCEAGDCVPRCQFAACDAGEACLDDGTCVESACATVTCGAGEICMGGTCVDACAGVTCPAGERCQVGACVGDDRPDGGPIPRDASVPPGIDAGPRADGGAAVDASAFDGGGGGPVGGSDGCSCRAAGTGGSSRSATTGALAVLALAALGRVRRRR